MGIQTHDTKIYVNLADQRFVMLGLPALHGDCISNVILRNQLYTWHVCNAKSVRIGTCAQQKA